jgi:hypothetical protein
MKRMARRPRKRNKRDWTKVGLAVGAPLGGVGAFFQGIAALLH